MQEGISALLVHNRPDPMGGLKLALQGLSVEIRQAGSCQDALRWLEGSNPPELVFTDTQLPDGTWSDVVRVVGGAPVPTNVIVVSRGVDVRFYVETVEAGAFDFIAPPFEASELAHVLRCAAGNVRLRRQREAQAERSAQETLPLPALHPHL